MSWLEAGQLQDSCDPDVCVAPGTSTRSVLALLHLCLGTGPWVEVALERRTAYRVGEVSSMLVAEHCTVLRRGVFPK